MLSIRLIEKSPARYWLNVSVGSALMWIYVIFINAHRCQQCHHIKMYRLMADGWLAGTSTPTTMLLLLMMMIMMMMADYGSSSVMVCVCVSLSTSLCMHA